jgi:hypothetical protein
MAAILVASVVAASLDEESSLSIVKELVADDINK